MARILLVAAFICSGTTVSSIRVNPNPPSPKSHPLYPQHHTKPPELSFYSPTLRSTGTTSPGFAAIRGLNAWAPQTWEAQLDLYLNSTAQGGLDLANMIWPGYDIVFSPYWLELATLLASRSIIATDLGGFVPGGVQDFLLADAANYTAGAAIMGDLLTGFDMGEQDVRYLWGYAGHSTPLGPTQRFEAYTAFQDYSSRIEENSGGKMVALSSSTYAVHHWLKSGLYTLAGSETSQSNGNAQVLYAFVRGAGKQYGVLWYGQVSIFNCFGYKIPGDPNPSPDCTSQSSHSPTCGTSLNLMKRLMYSQLAYNSAYFAFEGGLLFSSNNSLTPIGTLQQSAKAFFAGHASSPTTLGVHVPTMALLLDFYGGWARPCDSGNFEYKATSWGLLPWDEADFFTDACLDTLFPGYRAGARLRNESAYQSPTPFGDAVDVLLSDVIPPVLSQYDTVILSHRLTTGSQDVASRLDDYVRGGGRVFTTASTLLDLGAGAGLGFTALGGVSVGPCTPAPAGTVIHILPNSTSPGSPSALLTEPTPFTLCTLGFNPSSPYTTLATTQQGGTPVAVRVGVGAMGGSVTILAAGSYGMTTSPSAPPPFYGCKADEVDTRENQPLAMALHVRALLEGTLAQAALFDLGGELAWVPALESPTTRDTYILTVTNPSLQEAPLSIGVGWGAGGGGNGSGVTVEWVEVLPLDTREKQAQGYLPHGFEGVDVGHTTNTTLAGGDTLILRVKLSSGSGTTPSPSSANTSAPGAAGNATAASAHRLLRLPSSTGDLRRAIQARPYFDSTLGGVVVDAGYLMSRTPQALASEGAWLRMHGVGTIVVDFTRLLTLFPGLRLVNDMGAYYQASMAAVNETLGEKMPALGASHALFALHGVSEIPPANFSGDPTTLTSASVAASLLTLATAPSTVAAGITLHLRRSTRNYNLAGTGLGAQAKYASASGLALAPSLAFTDPRLGGDSEAEVEGLFNGGGELSPPSRLFLLSSVWSTMGGGGEGGFVEGGGLSLLDPTKIPTLQALHSTVLGVGGWVVMDSGYTEDALGRAQELQDIRFLEGVIGQ
jgi:hypothetical protein